ncbi:hypothetical protein NEOLEDRAFT_1092207 [Neolentinus lepideus HHB14362 ss-1]|uniref:Uncharacterized protein n=1 Tax=Neolentinus lepideus HHB14362 ss-1 TaxID=1314782 RepID=A0A165SV11_9AGAM|nr:hypothetical protein NEOLEDRAFT_1092207 [Neolentinus lepideus HHB14362 ss-1]
MSCRNSSPDPDRSQIIFSTPRRSPTPDDERRSDLSPHPPNQNASAGTSCSQQRTVLEVVEERFPPFDHRSAVVDPFEEENRRDAQFREKLNEMLLNLMIEVHAWSTARPASETNQNIESLEKEINNIMTIENEQGMSPSPSLTFIGRPTFRSLALQQTRQRLGEFVNRIKIALAALTGI